MARSDNLAESKNISTVFLSLRGRLARAVKGIVPPKEVEDIVQETYVRVCQAEYSGPIHAPQSFMFKTARNLALDYVRSSNYQLSESLEDSDDEGQQVADGSADATFGQVASNEQFGRFCEAVRSLPTQCRRIFVLKKVYGYSQREIARATGLSESTVEKHIAKGIRRCRQFMLQYDAPENKTRQTGSEKPSARRQRRAKERGR